MRELLVAYGLLPGEEGTDPDDLPPLPEPDGAVDPAAISLVAAHPGAGQSTLAVGLAQAWSTRGRRVLVVDLDPAEELARSIQIGSAILATASHSVLVALRDGLPLEPLGTVLPGVDIVVSGTINSWDADLLPAVMRGRPQGLGEVLAPWRGVYDRVIIDAPVAPGSVLDAALRASDRTIPLLPCARYETPSPVWPRLTGPGAPPMLGICLTRWSPAASPSAEWLAQAYGPWALYLDTVVPELPGLSDPWDVAAGHGGASADTAFAALAAEIDRRLARPDTTERR